MFYSAEEHICVATSDSPFGPFVQDEKKPIREEKGIDTSVFFDTYGKTYLYFVICTHTNVIWCAELKDNMKEIEESTLTKCIEVSKPWETLLGEIAEGSSSNKTLLLSILFGEWLHQPRLCRRICDRRISIRPVEEKREETFAA